MKEDSVAKILKEMLASERSFIIANGIRAKLEHWAKFTSWTKQEAIYVMRGIDFPKMLAGDGLFTEAKKNYFPTFAEIRQTEQLADRAVLDRELPTRAHPTSWLLWAKKNNIPVIENLPELVHEHLVKTKTPEQRSKYQFQEVGKEEIDAGTAKDKPRDDLSEPETFEMVQGAEVRIPFYEQIRIILSGMSREGRGRPTASQMRTYLAKNPKSASLFVGITRRNDIEYAISDDHQEITTLGIKKLQSLIYRVTKVTEKDS